MSPCLRSAPGRLLSAQAGTALVVQIVIMAPLSLFAAILLMLMLAKP